MDCLFFIGIQEVTSRVGIASKSNQKSQGSAIVHPLLLFPEKLSKAEHSESKANFKHKLAIAQNEKNETIYWLELLKESE